MPQQTQPIQHDQQAGGVGGRVDAIELLRIAADAPAHTGAGLGVLRAGLRRHPLLEPGFGLGDGPPLGFRRGAAGRGLQRERAAGIALRSSLRSRQRAGYGARRLRLLGELAVTGSEK